MPGRYILNGREPVLEPDLIAWARWFEGADRVVGRSLRDDVEVSTVFLGLDHRFHGDGRPILFETLVFVNEIAVDGERYSTWDEAEAGHARWVAKIFKPTPVLTLP